MRPRTERNRRRDQTARLPGRWRKLRYDRPRDRDPEELEALAPHPRIRIDSPDRVQGIDALIADECFPAVPSADADAGFSPGVAFLVLYPEA